MTTGRFEACCEQLSSGAWSSTCHIRACGQSVQSSAACVPMSDSSMSSEHGVQWSMCSSVSLEHEFRMCNVVQRVFTCARVEAIGHAEHVIPWDSIHYKLKRSTKTKGVLYSQPAQCLGLRVSVEPRTNA